MKLVRIRIRNFRCFSQEIAIDLGDLTALIGRNDAGKSTVMEALDVFLNDECPDKDDGSKSGDPKDLAIICEFDDLPPVIIIDEDHPTSLAQEYLLNTAQRLEIHKTYSGHLATPKCTGIFAFAHHPTIAGTKDLLQLKNNDLKKRAKEFGIDLSHVDQKINSQLRVAIRSNFADLQVTPTLIPLNEDNAKNVWNGLKLYLPVFALFKSDRPSTDQDPEAQDPLKAAVREAIKAKEAELAVISRYVEDEVKKVSKTTLEKLREMDPSLASQLNPQFSPQKWDSVFKASITGDEGIPINKRGSGVKRLILLNFFRAKAELKAKDGSRSDVIYGIEEPETSQHPDNQRMLVRAFSELSTEAQVVLSTHTPMLARAFPDTCLRYIQVNKDSSRSILVGGATTNMMFAKSLGILPDNDVKLFIGVEGPHDISFLLGISRALIQNGEDIIDLEEMEKAGKLIFFPLGGSTLALWTSRLEKLNRPEFHLFDRDTSPPASSKYHQQVSEINQRSRCKATTTNKKELENYLHKDAIMLAYADQGIKITLPKNFGDFDDVPLEIAKLVHLASESSTPWATLDEKKRGKKESKAKHILNIFAAKHMNLELLSQIDPNGDVLSWFADIKSLINQ